MSRASVFFERLLHLLSVPRCVSCGEPLDFHVQGLCPVCRISYENTKDRNCSRCSQVLYRCDCSNNFLSSHCVKRLVKLYRYINSDENLAANSLIYSLKKDNRRDVLNFLTEELAGTISSSVGCPQKYLFTNVPRRRRAIVEYGIDHSGELARALAKHFGAEYKELLVSKATLPQKAMHGIDRLKNAEVSPKRDLDLTGRRVILVDDIVTTGASMAASAMSIRGMGAKEIIGATIAVAYKDN